MYTNLHYIVYVYSLIYSSKLWGKPFSDSLPDTGQILREIFILWYQSKFNVDDLSLLRNDSTFKVYKGMLANHAGNPKFHLPFMMEKEVPNMLQALTIFSAFEKFYVFLSLVKDLLIILP